MGIEDFINNVDVPGPREHKEPVTLKELEFWLLSLARAVKEELDENKMLDEAVDEAYEEFKLKEGEAVNYEDMENEELDRLAAEMMGGEVWYNEEHLLLKPFNIRWNPTHPDSNQAERYLFPKLKDKGCTIKIEDAWIECYTITITKWPKMEGEVVHPIELAETHASDVDKINRTKTIACLKAWDKLNKESEGAKNGNTQ